ncbi:TonB-linked SusC/RagA family outer membrane protein [Pedobacter metabolipauper]|uniref:TonB-linked SusC/RagA family outer membrane protein n=2 Tax=Pedobacter metabolipauper TaxID=425513 RepID=A0A4R6T1X2_9SPHI|nr:TonB-linked SusC/RagA family outer membrane protein [Pedobacter metabolipauper]
MGANAGTKAQLVTISVKGANIKEVFKELEEQTDYRFLYNERIFDRMAPISLQVKNESLDNVLGSLFKGQGIIFRKRPGTITLRADENLRSVERLTKQDLTIIGTVTDSIGPIPGVSVVVKGKSSIGTTTDLNGKYVLEVPVKDAILVFSMVGFKTVEVPLTGKKVVDVTLKIDQSGLEEVVVVGYGTQKKESVIGSITTINPKELKVPSSNLTTALAGRIAGVIAYQRSGEPGADDAQFFIRGATTFGYRQSPLILIDGMEYTTTDLARLQPDDIKEFSILKDATASAVYGARGANGVILVTTKGGVEGKPRISFRAENSLSAPTKQIELADPITYMRLSNEAVLTRDPLGETIYSQSQIDNTIAGTNAVAFPTVDWQESLFKDYTLNQRYNFNLSGGGQAMTYYISGTYNKDNGVLKVDNRNNFNSNVDLGSYNLRSNVNINVSKTTKVGIRLNGNFDDYTGPLSSGEDIYKMVMRAPQTRFLPYYPDLPGDKALNHIKFGNTLQGNAVNPYAEMVKGYREYSRSLMVAQVELNQDLNVLTEGLSFNAMMNTNRRAYSSVGRQYTPFWYGLNYYDKLADTYQLTALNDGSASSGGGTDWLDFVRGSETVNAVFHLQSALNYSRSFAKHNVSGMGILVMRSETQSNAATLQQSLPIRNLGVSGRATYNYDSRYFFEFNFGYNGSERFSAQNRFGFFPSAGVAWAVSNEAFFEKLRPIVSKLRLRANLGLVGNDQIGSATDRFFYLSEVNMNEAGYGYLFGTTGGYGGSGYSISRYANPAITWETSKNTTLGVELGLWNKFNLTAEYFMDHRYNILMNRASIPATMGLQATQRANVGEVRSRSTDLQLDYSDNIGKDFYLSLRGNFTFSQNRYEAFEEPAYAEPWLYRKGHSTSQRWGYVAERLFVDDNEVQSSPVQNFGGFVTRGGDIKYRDINQDGVINSLDQVAIGFPTVPEIVYGFGFSSRYKAIDFSAFFQGSARSSFWIDVNATSPFINYRSQDEISAGFLNGKQLQNQLLDVYANSHWSEENRDLYAIWPRLSSTYNGNSNQSSTWFMRSGAFLRLKSVELGYTFPKRLSKRINIDNLRLYGSATNLFTISGFKYWDVEMAGNGLGYPLQRVMNIGLQLDF